jgi:hypothetical protein
MTVYTYSGKAGWAGLGIEATPGTQVDPSVYIPYEDIGTKDEDTIVIPTENRGTFDNAYHVVRTAADGQVSLKCDAFPEMGLEHLLYGLFGAKSTATTATNAYTHTFTQANTAPTFSVHSGLTTADAGAAKPIPRVYNYAMVDGFKLDFKEKETVKLDATLESASVNLDTTPATPTYASNNPRPFVFPDLTFKIADFGSSATQDPYVQTLSLDFKKGVQKEWIANGSLGAGVMVPSIFELSGKFSKIFTDMQYYKDFLGAGSPTAFSRTLLYKNVSFELTGDEIPSSSPSTNYAMTITIPKCLITTNDVKWSGDGVVKNDLDFRAVYDTVTSKTASMTVTSGLSSIA